MSAAVERSTRATQTLRGSIAAVIALFVAAFSHGVAGGSAPGFAGVVLAFALALPSCVFLAGRKLSHLRLLVAVGVSQFGFHLCFGVGAGAALKPPVAGAHAHNADVAGLLSSGAVLTETHSHADPGMWLWHVFAALITTLLLARGEHSVVAAVRALRLRLARWAQLALKLPTTPSSLQLTVVAKPVLMRRPLVTLSALRHRGPPISALV